MIVEYDDYKYDKAKDIEEVCQIGFLDLRKAYETHTVPGNLEVDETVFNDMDDPEMIGSKVTNIFEAVQHGQEIAAVLDRASSEG